MAVSIIGPKFYAWDSDTGKPLAFGKVYTYQAGTNTPKATFTTEGGETQNANPVILNGAGYANIYLQGSYKIVVKDADDVEVWTSDPVSDPSQLQQEWVRQRNIAQVNTSTFTVDGELTEEYVEGVAVRVKQDSGFVIGTVASATYAGGKTTVTLDFPGTETITTSAVYAERALVSFQSLPKNLGNRTIYVGSVAELEALPVSIGANVKTLGYNNPGDGGGNDYEIVAGGTGTADGGSFIDLNNGLQAKALSNGPIAKTPYGSKIAYILWTGQSNAVQPFDNGSPADVISPKAKIWNGANFVQMAAGVGGISADATTHSLFNFTRNLADQCGYDEVRVIFVAVSGRPISDWVGTPADRTINSTNTPRMQEIIDAASAANVPEFTHIVMIQGEANSGINTLPFPTNEPGSYSYEREYFRQSLSDQGFASADSKWLEVELIGKETGNSQWRINTAINALDKVGRPNVAIVPSYGFKGVDEGNTVNLNGTLVPWRQHFSSEENSELGNRLFRKAYELELIRDSNTITNHIIETAPDGKIGYTRPWVSYTSGTYDLSSRWARGAVVVIVAGETVNINLLADDIRTGFGVAAGKTIQFKIENSATLNLTTETVDIFDKTGGNRPSTNSISRTGSATSSEIIELVFQGLRWELIRDLSDYSASGATRWSIYDGLLHIAGYVNVGLNAGDFTDYTFPVDMPPIKGTGYIPTAEGACVCTNKTTSGFRITRIATVTTGGTVSFQVFNAAMAAL